MRRRAGVTVSSAYVIAHARAPFSQHLERMPFCRVHRVEHPINECQRHQLVEQVTHGVYKDHSRTLPMEGLFEPLWSQRQIKTSVERVADDTAEPFGKSLS